MSTIESLVVAGKYNYQAFYSAGISQASCAATMRQFCAPAQQGLATFWAMDSSPNNANQTVAAFLITRCARGWRCSTETVPLYS